MKEEVLSGNEIEVPGLLTRLVNFICAPFHYVEQSLQDLIPALKKSSFISGLISAVIVIYSLVAIVWGLVKLFGIIYVWIKGLIG